jgi:hypothetical protein
LLKIIDGFWQNDLPLAFHDIAQGAATDIRHNQVSQPITLAIFVNGHDIGMFEGSSSICLAPETFKKSNQVLWFQSSGG